MDREDLDKQLKENGEAMKDTSRGSRSGRMKIAALALAMLVIGGAGGCYFGGFSGTQKSPAASSYQMPQGSNKKMEDLPAIRNTAVVQAVKEVGPTIAGPTSFTAGTTAVLRRAGRASILLLLPWGIW